MSILSTSILKKLRRGGLLAGLAVLAAFAAGGGRGGGLQAQSSDRAKQLGAKMLCMCGCGQGLTACNHVGCTKSGAMLKELDQRIAAGDSDDLILQSFVQEYGEKVLAEPPTHGFNSLAWFIPAFAFAGGLALVVVVIRQWRHRTPLAATAGGPPISPEMMERARREIERETEDL